MKKVDKGTRVIILDGFYAGRTAIVNWIIKSPCTYFLNYVVNLEGEEFTRTRELYFPAKNIRLAKEGE